MLIPLGFLAASGVAAGSFDLLETQVLGSAAASVTFSNLNSSYGATYQHLQLRITARDAGSNASFGIRFNGNSSSIYSRHELNGNGSNVTSAAGTSENVGYLGTGATSSSATGVFTGIVVDIVDPFETTKNKVLRAFNGTTSPNNVFLVSNLWANTEAVTSIQILSRFGTNLAANSRFSLYGIKAA
jgi:hypothetical protein